LQKIDLSEKVSPIPISVLRMKSIADTLCNSTNTAILTLQVMNLQQHFAHIFTC